jgi:tetratricopeptide (TPR) repeat protein
LAQRSASISASEQRVLLEGVKAHQRGRLDEAAAFYRRVLKARPSHADALHLLGLIAYQRGQHQEAVSQIRRAIAANDRIAAYHNSLGVALLADSQPAPAAACFHRALALDPGYAEAHNNLGNALAMQRDVTAAEACYRQALAIRPEYAEAHANLAASLLRQRRMEEAEAACRQALAIQPRYATAYTTLGRIFSEQGRYGEAFKAYEKAIALHPAHAEARTNRALLLLLHGRFAEGFVEYEWRWRAQGFATPTRDFSQPLWDGSDLGGRSILVHAEQGKGSAIQFVRYVPLVVARNGRVVLECHRPLARLFGSLASAHQGAVEVVVKGDALPPFDVQIPLMSLPRLFTRSLETIPQGIPYLEPSADAVAAWQTRLSTIAGPRVGLTWAGNRLHANDHNRSLPPSLLKALLEKEGISFVSLQIGEGSDAGGSLPGAAMFDPTPDIGDFDDTAAIITQLDLVISVDTAVAHLAGALGRPVWLMLPFDPDWRWLLDREDSPWYPTMRLFRQTRPGDWTGVLERVGVALGDGSGLR